MTRHCYALAIALAVAGCAGTDTQLRMLEKEGAYQIEPSQNKAAYDYVVRITNLVDVGYNPDNPETRNGAALRGLRTQCPSGRIVGEDVVEKGAYANGRPAREYFIHVKCG